ncbi:uncharacterized protein N7473_008606 [Penicillium subrubescens]|uniref:Major facilitator superfamily (MFS) profile domain-containing protein n=1 Tax=Penicillium subrubescens TaxID=1316194 RepID=A0A1Q5U030_9EURO|nr:uncharacterized protein N7473_008606 [Penicillium subrubescens]KAJ5885932.1 hypothetical protein N7473_008606 [Penicillium subrubescens]OKP05833.1 hypothetical protein PENSUB_6553 [Penicillium subrubescens]
MSTTRRKGRNRSSQDSSGEDTEKASPSAPPAPIPKDPNLVERNGPNDPENPQNFAPAKKWLITVLFSSMTMWVTFSSSIFSAAVEVIAKEYNVSNEVTTLGTSLTLLVDASLQSYQHPKIVRGHALMCTSLCRDLL